MEHLTEENQIRKNLAISQFKFNVCKWEELQEEQSWVEKYNGKLQIRQKYGGVLAEHLESLVEEIKYIGEQYGLSLDFLSENRNKQDQITAKTPQSIPIQEKVVK